jgi:hypothetical protein
VEGAPHQTQTPGRACRSEPDERLRRMLPVVRDLWRLAFADVAEPLLYLCPGDERPRRAIDVTREFCHGRATSEQLAEANLAAWTARDSLPPGDIARAACSAAGWVSAPEPVWLAEDVPWKLLRVLPPDRR